MPTVHSCSEGGGVWVIFKLLVPRAWAQNSKKSVLLRCKVPFCTEHGILQLLIWYANKFSNFENLCYTESLLGPDIYWCDVHRCADAGCGVRSSAGPPVIAACHQLTRLSLWLVPAALSSAVAGHLLVLLQSKYVLGLWCHYQSPILNQAGITILFGSCW